VICFVAFLAFKDDDHLECSALQSRIPDSYVRKCLNCVTVITQCVVTLRNSRYVELVLSACTTYILKTSFELGYGGEWSRVSSGSIVSDYELDDRAIGVRSPAAEEKGFFLYLVSRPVLGPTQPSLQWVPVVLSPGVKRGQGVMLTTHPHLVPRS
jgi:hypothetical protein